MSSARQRRQRERITSRLAELTEQVREIEQDAERRGFACGCNEGGVEARPNPILERILEPIRDELRRARGSMQRLERREQDCCIHCGRDIEESQLEATPYAACCTQCSKDFPDSYRGQMQAQHQDLTTMMLELLELVSQIRWKHAGGKPADVEVGAWAVLVAHLDRTLHRHFAAEEEGGYMFQVLEAAPRLQRKVEMLEREHGTFSQDLAALRELAVAVPPSPDWPRVQRDMQDFATRLLDHENAENRMMQHALFDDLGGG